MVFLFLTVHRGNYFIGNRYFISAACRRSVHRSLIINTIFYSIHGSGNKIGQASRLSFFSCAPDG
jgi:hypothetical protein